MHERRFDGEISRLRDPNRLERLEVSRVIDLCLKGIEARSLLDIGTGSGLFAEKFAHRGLVVAGIDANPDMVEAARGFLPEGDFRLAEAEALPYPDRSFDMAFMGVLLHEADNPEKALSEAGRVARKRVAVLEWPHQKDEFPPPLAHRLTQEEIDALARTAGLSITQIYPLTHTVLYFLDLPASPGR